MQRSLSIPASVATAPEGGAWTREALQRNYMQHMDLLKTNPEYQRVVQEFQGPKLALLAMEERDSFQRDAKMAVVIVAACLLSLGFSIIALAVGEKC